ncbi:MAG TPA: SAF domain-containing protein [Dehalococcoidia bacterium]|nr:SAF domain-containing protein [Dehalococcoidia bacterium]
MRVIPTMVLLGVALAAVGCGGGGDDGVPVVVATGYIPAGTLIEEGMVSVQEVPADLALISGACTDTNMVVGQLTRVPLAEGEQVTGIKIGSPSQAVLGCSAPDDKQY